MIYCASLKTIVDILMDKLLETSGSWDKEEVATGSGVSAN